MNVQIHSVGSEAERRRILLPSSVSRSPVLPPLKADRVVLMAALSERIPDRFITEAFAHTLRAETGHTVMVIHLEGAGARLSMADWLALPLVNGEFALGKQVETTEGGVALLRLKLPASTEEEEQLPALIDHCVRNFHYILLRAGTAVHLPVLLKCFALADRIFVLLQPRQEDFYARDLLRREVRERVAGSRVL